MDNVYRFVGRHSIIGDREFTQIGQQAEFSEAEFLEVSQKAAFIPDADFDSSHKSHEKSFATSGLETFEPSK
jgi:peptidase E